MTMKKTSHALPVILLIGILLFVLSGCSSSHSNEADHSGQSVIPRQKYYLRLPPAKKFTKITVHPSMRHIFPKDISW